MPRGTPPSSTDLLRMRVLDVRTYAAEALSKRKISKAQSMALYGSPIVPIPVPLKANETLEAFEAGFVDWLFRERNLTKERFETNANLERSCRCGFQRTEFRAFLLTGDGDDDNVKEEVAIKTEDDVVFVSTKREREDGEDESPVLRKMKGTTQDGVKLQDNNADEQPAALIVHEAESVPATEPVLPFGETALV